MKHLIQRLLMCVLACLMLPAVILPAQASGEQTIGITQPDTSSQPIPMYAENLFPGDAVNGEFLISIRHQDPVDVHFHADIRPGYEILAEVLEVSIALPQQGITLYSGLMRDMPASVVHSLDTGEDTLLYAITVSLPTSAGNRYQNQGLIADFRWWYLEEQEPVTVKLAAEKVLDGQYPRGSDFTFQLQDGAGVLLQSVNNRDGTVEFSALSFTEPGVYTYTVTELAGTAKGMAYDDTVYTVTVTLQEDMSVQVAYTRDGEPYTALPRFVNTTEGYNGGEDPENPKTGDGFLLPWWIFLCLASAIAIVLILTGKRKGAAYGT